MSVPPGAPPTLEGLHALASYTARAVERLEREHESSGDRIARLEAVEAALAKTARTLGDQVLLAKQIPLSRLAYVLSVAIPAFIGGLVAELLVAGLRLL